MSMNGKKLTWELRVESFPVHVVHTYGGGGFMVHSRSSTLS